MVADDPGEARVGSVGGEELLGPRKELRGDCGYGNSTSACSGCMNPAAAALTVSGPVVSSVMSRQASSLPERD
ncbi:MAG TPA: hypothetical protein VF070_36535 [Streptosporangiaceae bacterium]